MCRLALAKRLQQHRTYMAAGKKTSLAFSLYDETDPGLLDLAAWVLSWRACVYVGTLWNRYGIKRNEARPHSFEHD